MCHHSPSTFLSFHQSTSRRPRPRSEVVSKCNAEEGLFRRYLQEPTVLMKVDSFYMVRTNSVDL